MSSASPQTKSDTKSLLKRCAVCKIDLKGRFVYIDEEIENLLGYTKEELFGKTISEFLSEDSQVLIESVLTYRNHYESFYDATDLTVVDREQCQILTSAVISLNFIAGNPVNYQIIINPSTESSNTSTVSARPTRLLEHARDLLGTGNGQNTNLIARNLRRLAGADAVFIYLVSENELVPRAGDFSDRPEFSFEAIPEPTDLHRAVAATGETYDFQRESSVRLAVELTGEAPSEIICLHSLGNDSSYLICARFSPQGGHQSIMNPVERLDLGLLLLEQLVAGGAGEEAEQSCDARFTVGFLDSLAIGAVLISKEGAIAGYNPSFTTIMSLESLQGDLSTITELLTVSDPNAPLEKVDSYFGSELDSESEQDLVMDVTAPSGTRCRLIVVRFSADAGDKSSCLVLMPFSPIAVTRPAASPVTESLVERITKSVGDTVDEIYQVSQRIAHENYDSLSEAGKGLLRRLDTLSLGAKTTIAELERSENLVLTDEAPQTIDINLTLDRTIASVRQRFPGQTFTCQFENLAPLTGNPELLGRIFESVFDQMIMLNDTEETVTTVQSESNDEKCLISIGHNVEDLHEVLSMPTKVNKKGLVKATSKFSLETVSAILAVRYLIERSGGTLESNRSKGKEFTLKITLPIA